MNVGLRIHDDGRTKTADVPGDYSTFDFLEVVLRELRPDSDINEWTLADAPDGRHLQLDRTLEENEIRDSQDLFLVRRLNEPTPPSVPPPDGGIHSSNTPVVPPIVSLEADIDRGSECSKEEVEATQLEEAPVPPPTWPDPGLKKALAQSSASSGDGLLAKHNEAPQGIVKWIIDRRVPICIAISILVCVGVAWILWPSTPKPPLNLRHIRIISLSPDSINASERAFTLTIIGEHFVPEATVTWQDVPLNVTYRTPTTLKADIPKTFIARPGWVYVRVMTPDGKFDQARFTIFPHFKQ
jgi:hypothetical protein